MPAPNDLTPEEEQAFIEHGVQPSGPGVEPTGEPSPGQVDNEPAAPVVGTVPVARDATGRFAPLPNAAQPVIPVEQTAPPTSPDQPTPPPPPPGYVPHQALHEARQREQQARAAAQLAQTRMNALLTRQAMAEAATVPEMPDIETNPLGYMQAMEQRIANFEQSRAEEQQNRQLDNAMENDEATFSMEHPDYNTAAHHYVMSRAQELMHLYPPDQVQQIMLNEARQMAREAWSRGMPAAQMVYGMAQARGYVPGGQPGFVPPAAQPGITPVQQVQQVQRGQAVTRTLSGSGGGAPAGQLNAEALLAMSDEEFADYCKLGSKGANAAFATVAGR